MTGQQEGHPRLKKPGEAVAALRHWQGDADLSGIRHPWPLLRLPGEERRAWQTLWADVDELRQRAANAR